MSDVDLAEHRICNADYGRVTCYCSMDWMTLDQYGEHIEGIAAERVRAAEAAVGSAKAAVTAWRKWRVALHDINAYRYGTPKTAERAANRAMEDLRDALTTPTPESGTDEGGAL